MTFIDICREICPNLKTNDKNMYLEYTKKLKDIFAALGIIDSLKFLKKDGEYYFPDKSKDFILFLLNEYSKSLAILRNESRQNEIHNEDIIYIYKNIDNLFKGRVNDEELANIKITISEKFNIPARHLIFQIENCEKQAKKTIETIWRTLLPEESRILLGKYYTNELCTMLTKICRKWEDITSICDDERTIEIIENSHEDIKNLTDSFSFKYEKYYSILEDDYCPEDPAFQLNEKLKNICELESIQTNICYLVSKPSKTGNKNKDNTLLEKLRNQKKELINQEIEKELQKTGLDFSEVIEFINKLPSYKATPSELVHEAIDYYLQNEHSVLGK